MTREIKFRWWNGQRMIPNENLLCCVKNIPDHYMQYTGLKDKNGVEIYEGDIVVIDEAIPRGDGEYDEGVARVVFRGSSFWFIGDIKESLCEWSLDFESAGDIKVIGNIHENPELIDKA